MKQEQSLIRVMDLMEILNLCWLTACLSCTFLFLFPEGSRMEVLLWALGAILPVQLIRFFGVKLEKPLHIWISSLAILALAVLIPQSGMRRFVYGLCCIPMLLAVTVLGRPEGKPVLTVPKLYHPLAGLLVYCFGDISQSDWLCIFGVAFSVLLLLCLVIHKNQQRLLKNLRDNSRSKVSLDNIVSLNRRLLLLFLCVGLIIVSASVYVASRREIRRAPQEEEIGTYEITPETEETEEEPDPKNKITINKEPRYINMKSIMENTALVFTILLSASAIGFVVYSIIRNLMNIGNDRSKHNKLKQGYEVEKLDPIVRKRQESDSADNSYARKIRKRYSKLILQRTKDHSALAPLSPEELEQKACLPTGRAADSIHQIYEKTRYSGQPVDREDYLKAKEAAAALDVAKPVAKPVKIDPDFQVPERYDLSSEMR